MGVDAARLGEAQIEEGLEGGFGAVDGLGQPALLLVDVRRPEDGKRDVAPGAGISGVGAEDGLGDGASLGVGVEGLAGVSEVGFVGAALGSGEFDVGVGEIELEAGIRARFRGQPTEVFRGLGDDAGAGIGGPRHVADAVVDIEEEGSKEGAQFVKAAFGERALGFRLTRLADDAGNSGDEDEHGQRAGGEGRAVAAGESAKDIEKSGWPGFDGLRGEVAFDIRGEGGAGGVALFGLLADGLEDDGVEVPGEALAEFSGAVERWAAMAAGSLRNTESLGFSGGSSQMA